jgi:hypothetical protein
MRAGDVECGTHPERVELSAEIQTHTYLDPERLPPRITGRDLRLEWTEPRQPSDKSHLRTLEEPPRTFERRWLLTCANQAPYPQTL